MKKKLIIEIPTYPYDQEIKSKLRLFIDRYYRKKLYKYVDKIVTFSDDREIWGIPCINISNGIDLDEVKLINKKNKSRNEIVITSVSNCSFWHGIDRFVNSLLEYKKNDGKEDIIFNIVGEGPETSKLKKIVKENEILKEIVIFHGFKTGKELDEIYNKTDIALGSLGRHRSGIKKIKPLKNREYCAKGIPMIFSEEDDDFIGKRFVYKVSADEGIIDIEELIKWYREIKMTPQEIRRFSERLSWDIQMKKVLDLI